MAAEDLKADPTAAEADARPRNTGPDGEKIIDMSYYDLLDCPGYATENELKKVCSINACYGCYADVMY